MQPCSEIVINAHKTLALTQNTIYGCEQMWRGINVQPFGRLNFQINEIRDAQYAIFANASGVAWPPPGGNVATTIEVFRNNFIQNHIGVYAIGFGSTSSNLWHLPFSRNTFIGNGANALLPPCDQNLPNWNANNGYAGVVSRAVNFTIGTSADIGYTNTFSGLKNGVIGENCWLEVNNVSISDIVGNWPSEALIPSFNFSEGIGILSNSCLSTVRKSVINISHHGIYASSGILTATNNNMPSVRRGIEAVTPFGFDLSNNQDIYYRNRGILGRNLQTGSSSPFLSYSVNKNVIHNLDQASVGTGGDMGIEMRDGNLQDLVNARMSENDIFLDASDFGIYISGVGRWTIDGNYVQHRALPGTLSSAGLSIVALNSPRNYLYNNTVEDISISPTSRGYNLASSPENKFCCNWSDGSDMGYQFLNACGSTSLKTSDMFAHTTAIQINETGLIGEQGPPNIPLNNFPNHDNVFNNTSGTARHFGITNAQISASKFHTLTDLTPDYPQAIAFPNSPGTTPDFWFEDDGVGQLSCANCDVPPALPEGQGNQIDAADLITAGEGFDYDAPGLQALQWESSRDLYRRMRNYPELKGKNSLLDAFYANSASANIGNYYIADSLVSDLSHVQPIILEMMEQAVEQIKLAEEESTTLLLGLSEALTWEDSMAIYRQADAARMGAVAHSENFTTAIEQSHLQRNAKADAIIPFISALQASNHLEQNRKDALLIYAQTIGKGSFTLNQEQASTISTIAHQCPGVDGSAVYIAREVYQLVETKVFNDETICGSEERATFIWQANGQGGEISFDLVPNPASDNVALIYEGLIGQDMRVALFNATGQVVMDRTCSSSPFLQIPLQGLPEGIYFCRVSTQDGKMAARRLVIRR